MANLLKGEGRMAYRGFTGNASHLPPRIPSFPSIGSPSLDSSTGLYCSQKNLAAPNVNQRQHQRTPSCSFLMQEQPSWLDDLLDDSEVPSKKGSHRRSASDSFTYLESPGGLYRISNIAEEEEFDCSSVTALQSRGSADLDHLDGDQLTSLLAEIQQLQKQQNLPVSVTMTSTPCSSKFENNRTTMKGALSNAPENPSPSNSTSITKASSEEISGLMACEPEAESWEDEEFSSQYGTRGESALVGPIDANLDPKRAKRILANRQSAQRSRVRKLQYIAELERSVNALQTEVSTLSPQVSYLEHQRALLNMDNNTLKQRIAIFMRDKKFKDSQNEVLKKEVQRLRKLYQFQMQRQEQKEKQQQPRQQLHDLQRHSSLPSDFDIQPHQFSRLNLGSPQQAESEPIVSDSFTGLMKNLGGVSLGAGSSAGTSCNSARLNGVRAVLPSSCTVAVGGKSLEGRLMTEGALMATDFMVQNS